MVIHDPWIFVGIHQVVPTTHRAFWADHLAQLNMANTLEKRSLCRIPPEKFGLQDMCSKYFPNPYL